MKKIAYILILLILAVLSIHHCNREGINPDTYEGDGEIKYFKDDFLTQLLGLNCGLFVINFNAFPLSSEHKQTYSFTGLTPINEHLNEYEVDLDAPPTIDGKIVEQATLEMTLYGDGEQLWTFKTLVKELDCLEWKDFEYDQEQGDGIDKNYHHPDFTIPADPKINYKLDVHYIPPKNIPEGVEGHVYLRIGGVE